MSQATQAATPRFRITRRGFLKASGVSAVLAGGTIGAIPFRESRAFAQSGWDEEHDIVVAGSGGAGFAAAVTAHALGSDVVVLEKGAYVGGTTLVSGGGMYIPASKQMLASGIENPRPQALQYMARYSFPALYNPDDEKLGLSDYDYDMITTYYDTAAEAMNFIEDAGAQKWAVQVIAGSVPENLPNVDYMDHFDENIPKGSSTLVTLNDKGEQQGGGGLIANYVAYAERENIPVKLFHRVERVVLNDDGQIVGVEVAVLDPEAAATPEASPVASPAASKVLSIRARKGVIFGSGGFARNEDMKRHFLPVPYYGGCSAPTNEGDFIKITSTLGAKLGNLSNVWRNEGIYEQAIADSGSYNCAWFYHGDSMLMVNGTGQRFVNERRNYQDRPMAHFDWDPNNATWPNLMGYLVWDSRTQDNWAGSFPFPTDTENTPYLIKADTLEDLAVAIRERVASLPTITKGLQLTDDFEANLVAEVTKFNEYAKSGNDLDFQRGQHGYDEGWATKPSAEGATLTEWPSPDQPLKSMYPLSDSGPYYATIMTASAVDSNGGPVINASAQILTYQDTPIDGLYGAGSCVASPQVNAYWAGGATLGNAHVFGYIAAKHAHESAEKPA